MKNLELINSKTRDAYNQAAEKYHNLFHNEMNEKEFDRTLLNAFASKFLKGSLICDAGCGPSAHIGKYLFDRGLDVIGVDISDRCIELATNYNPEMKFKRNDLAKMDFESDYFDGIVSYYSIIHTPKSSINVLFNEFYRILKQSGYLLIAVKFGSDEGFLNQFLGIDTEIYFSLFTLEEIVDYFNKAGFKIESIQRRNPYDFEINNDRIFAIGQKIRKIRL